MTASAGKAYREAGAAARKAYEEATMTAESVESTSSARP